MFGLSTAYQADILLPERFPFPPCLVPDSIPRMGSNYPLCPHGSWVFALMDPGFLSPWFMGLRIMDPGYLSPWFMGLRTHRSHTGSAAKEPASAAKAS